MSRPGFEPGLLRPQRGVLTTRRAGLISKPPFLALILFESIFVFSWYQLFCCAVVKGCFHQHCKMKSCSDQDSNLGYCGHNAVSVTTRRSGPISKPPFLALILFESIFVISWYQLFCCAVVKGCFHQHCKMKSCPDQDSNLGYCGHNVVF